MTGVKHLILLYKNISKSIKRFLSLFLLLSLTLSSNSPVFTALAQETSQQASISASIAPSPTLLPTAGPTSESALSPTPSPVLPLPTETAVPPAPESPTVSPTLAPLPTLATSPQSLPSAGLRQPVKIRPLARNYFSASQSVVITVLNSQDYQLETEVKDRNNEIIPLTVEKESNTDFTTIRIPPSLTFKPGKYTLTVKDQTAASDTVDFTWGNFVMNLNKNNFKPQESGKVSLSLSDDSGKIICNADLQVQIKKDDQILQSFATSAETIKKNPDCANSGPKKDQPDYQFDFNAPAEVNSYQVFAQAKIANITYEASDLITVADLPPLTLERQTATRIDSANWQSVNLIVTANADIRGIVSDSVPDTLDIASPDTSRIRNYDNIRIENTWYNKGSILGTFIPPLRIPFDTAQHQTLGFGDNLVDPVLIRMYSQFGLSGHDGIDYDLPIGTPIFAADSGLVVLAGSADYGQTVVIEHQWGKSYYGHLSEITAVLGQKVSKGDQIGLSGNTGLSTGAHLHFTIKPALFDYQNGYYGKINPLPYLEIPENQVKPDVSPPTYTSTALARIKKLTWNLDLKKGERVTLGYQYKTPASASISYLIGPLTYAQSGSVQVQAASIHQLITDYFETAGAQFPQQKASFSMEHIDRSLLNVPDDYPPLKSEFDKSLVGKYSSLELSANPPAFTMSTTSASASATISFVKMSLNDISQTSSPVTSNNQIVWNQIKPSINLQYETYDGYLNQKLTLESDRTDKKFTLNIGKSENLTIEDYFGHILFKNKDSQEDLFLFRSPQGIDANDNRIDYKYKIENDNTLTLYPNRSFQYEKASYPITIYFPVNVIAWHEASLQVGINCSDPGCGADGDILEIYPAGWWWGNEAKRLQIQVKTPKLTFHERIELTSLTKGPPEPEEKEAKEKDKLYQERAASVAGLKRYGIDYTQIASPENLKLIRSRDNKKFNPVLDSRHDKNIFRKKTDMLQSVIPSQKRLAAKPEDKLTILSRTINKWLNPSVYAAATTCLKTIGSAVGRDYSDLTDWEAARQGNLTNTNCAGGADANGRVEQAQLYADSTYAATDSYVISGSTTDSSHYMYVTARDEDHHNGTAGTGVVFTCSTCPGANFDGVYIFDDYFRIEWIELTGYKNGNPVSLRLQTSLDVLAQYIIIHDFDYTAVTSSDKGIGLSSSSSTPDSLTLRNTIIYDGGNYGFRGGNTGDTATIENVTVFGINDSDCLATECMGVSEFSAADGLVVRNSIIMDTLYGDIQMTSGGSTNLCEYDVCEDNATDCNATRSSETCTNTLTNRSTSSQFVSTTAGSEDFHLKKGSDAINKGKTLTTFNTDIDLQLRPSSINNPWDIGADEFAPTNPYILKHGLWWDSLGNREAFTF